MDNLDDIKISIISEDLFLQENIIRFISKLGKYEINSFKSVNELVVEIEKSPIPQLLIVDLYENKGIECIESLSNIKNKINEPIPVIFLSKKLDKMISNKLEETELLAFIQKPVDLNQIQIALEILYHNFIDKKKIITNYKKTLDVNQIQINELMETQRHLISATWRERDLKEELKKNKLIIEAQNKNILDSINYAKRIQRAILPNENYFKEVVPDSFLIYRPKDIVSGDFYFTETIKTKENDELAIIVVGDSTGHGVPGSLISVLGMSLLKQYILEEFNNSSAHALNYLNKKISILLRQQDSDGDEVKDGIDIVCCIINYKTLKLNFAGANNPIWIIKKKGTQHLLQTTNLHEQYELIEIKPDKQPVGYNIDPKPFTNHEIQLSNGDTFYIFSDGFVDQFGGPKGKKFKSRQLKELLISIQDHALEKQKEILLEAFLKWKGQLEQVDDVCLLGIRV